MGKSNRRTSWQRWVRQPQTVSLRRAIFQVHLWSGVSLGLYIFFISVTGSVLVYRNELYVAATPEPVISESPGPLLSDDELADAAVRAYPDYAIARFARASNPDEAVRIWLDRDGETRKRLFDPRSGADIGSAAEIGVWLVSRLIDLHADLLAGPSGRRVNGIGAFAVLLSAGTGLVIWWPGISRWRRSLTLRRGVGWKRFTWDLHSAIGFWSFAFTVIFAVSGLYLCYPETFHAFADRLDPPAAAGPEHRFVDSALAWLAYSHFGRINGIGLPCSGPGLCDQTTKAVWAVFGAAPAAMFVTGAIMWWNRVLQPWRRRASSGSPRTRSSADNT
ncbi:MAG: PepSY domain-containing protein [Gammaproteobacteria bacterium]|nr:PepSY domain-containing protein [Gammaproteobacteria bacterium]